MLSTDSFFLKKRNNQRVLVGKNLWSVAYKMCVMCMDKIMFVYWKMWIVVKIFFFFGDNDTLWLKMILRKKYCTMQA